MTAINAKYAVADVETVYDTITHQRALKDVERGDFITAEDMQKRILARLAACE